ncbi:YAP-binding/ALF4/Glomulin [Lasallia pustulata]|uniref:YAP-binding/ALF4/Glomulin n=1 Tax=Lasallia pustulata TaxID=136370 RepID=A0A1W5D5E1_9LECA|nr:YAP-binding/ALF4/Glomulin [Lasallia pustulata]
MSDNVLLKALPPAVDYLAYLTILEYNLTSDQLPVLHDILQDTTLTTNIGWDLVHLLLPLLPASKECLHDVARLGNPREVILKTTELLEGLGLDDDEEEDDEEKSEAEEQPEGALATEGTEGSKKSGHIARDTAISRQEPEDAQTHPEHGNQSGEPTSPSPAPAHPNLTNPDANPPPPLSTSSRPIREFTTLLDMLSVLHPRIKTAYPSRFLATTLRAILRPYSRLARFPAATSAVLKFLRVMSGTYRPVLPPRQSTASLSRLPAPDPEAQKEDVSAEETALQTRLLQAFLTHVLEDYMSSLRLVDEVPGMAWASRFSEMSGLERAMPGRKLYNQRKCCNLTRHNPTNNEGPRAPPKT